MKRADSTGGLNFLSFYSTGVLKPPHPRRLGAAFLLLLKLDDMVTSADGKDGLVFGGSPVSDRRLAKEMGVARSTVFEWRHRLLKGGYITLKRTDRGFAIRVRKSVHAYLRQGAKSASQKTGRPTVVSAAPPLPKTSLLPAENTTPPTEKTTAYKEDEFRITNSEKQLAAASPASPAWKSIGLENPVGALEFRRLWESTYASQNGGALSVVMGVCLDAWQTIGGKAPAQFAQAIERIRKLERDQAKAPVSDPLAGILAKPEDIPAWQKKH